MKIIHTSDWHLGQVFNEYDRTAEHVAFFRRLAEVVSIERPDALVVSGDIYHNSVPSASVQRLFTDSVLALRAACPDMSVVITAGNHDSGSRLEVDRNLWDHIGVKVIGGLYRTEGEADLERHTVEIPSRDGGLAGYVVALPHIYPQNYPSGKGLQLLDGQGCSEDGGGDSAPSDSAGGESLDRQRAFYRRLLQMVAERNPDRLPVVMMAHLAMSGCDITGHDRMTGGMEYTSLETFGCGYDYLALGHIHHPQTLAGARELEGGASGADCDRRYHAPVARYSGSPLQVSFDEDYPHSVSVVTISAGSGSGASAGEERTVAIREVAMPALVPMLTLPSEPVEFAEALECLRSFPDEDEAYVRLNVRIRDYLPQNAAVEAVRAAEGKRCRYCYIKVEREAAADAVRAERLTVQEIKEMSPADIARMYYRQKFSCEMDHELEGMLEEVVHSVLRDNDK